MTTAIRSRLVALSLTVLSLVVGAATGLAAVVVHSTLWGWLLAVGCVLVVAVALRPGWWTPAWWVRSLFCGAWAATVFALAAPRPDGDYLVSGDAAGYGLLVVALVMVLVGLAGLVRGRARADVRARPTSP